MKEKKVPLRRCAGCNEQKPKRELVRIVRSPEGQILLDETGKANGRGVYLCPKKSCLQKVRKSKRPDKSLGVPIPDEVYLALEEKLGS